MTSIYLVRHCQAQGNVNRVFQGRIDSEISEEGRRQLDRLAERFRRFRWTRYIPARCNGPG